VAQKTRKIVKTLEIQMTFAVTQEELDGLMTIYKAEEDNFVDLVSRIKGDIRSLLGARAAEGGEY
jgi:hypothetical protein